MLYFGMNQNETYIDLLLKSSSKENMLDIAQKISHTISINNLHTLNIHNYTYNPKKAEEELGIDMDLINQLMEDFVVQIIKNSITFMEFIVELQDLKTYTNNLDYTILRNLAHKNLGVAKNLRIDDIQKILEKAMEEIDLDVIIKCVECLCAKSILLKPDIAYQTIRLIQVKESF